MASDIKLSNIYSGKDLIVFFAGIGAGIGGILIGSYGDCHQCLYIATGSALLAVIFFANVDYTRSEKSQKGSTQKSSDCES